MILDQLAASTRKRVEQRKKEIPFEVIKSRALQMEATKEFPFEKALAAPGMSFICEVKKASPSKGLIAPDFPWLQIAKEYEAAGASAISVLTEPEYFLGSDQYLKEIAREVSVPVLRKDFTVDAYQIYEAKLLGASAVLLICTLLDQAQLKSFLEIAHSLGLSALVEAHDAEEVEKALRAGARVIGVNNRDLKTFTVDVNNSVRLRSLIPEDKLYVSESGIRDADDVGVLYRNGTNAVLIGETLMRSPDQRAMLDELRSKCHE
ncbi:MAG: indole-3-glycerol phosphate synthase TrpC [Eubacteriales bacterium]|nr:indole-3-glycerol phosphate synthase TrpC [Eubacteriales bacterium]